MKTVDSLDALWGDALHKLLNQEQSAITSRDGDVAAEIFGWTGRLSGEAVGQRFVVLNPRRAVDVSYTCAELLWFLSGKASAEALLPYAPSYTRWLQPDGTAYGGYGWRACHKYLPAIEHLRRQPHSLRAVVSVWRPDDLENAERYPDVPCVLSWQMSIRNGALIWETHMRSNDVWLGMPHDLSVFCMLHHLAARSLGLEIGEHIHHVHTLHLYERYYARAEQADDHVILGDELASRIAAPDWPVSAMHGPILWQDYVSAERTLRVNHDANYLYDADRATLLDAVVLTAAAKWRSNLPPNPSPTLVAALKLRAVTWSKDEC